MEAVAIPMRPTPGRFAIADDLHARVPIAPGKAIPGTRYKVLGWLGEGGMGTVYEAEHLDVGRRSAVKLLHHRFCGDPEALRLFRSEARITGTIGSPHIVQVHDFAELADGRLMMAMELLEGDDLTAELAAPIDPARFIAIMRQCCKGLAAAHDAGLVHRDIKPENIFLTSDGGRADYVKLLDFGVAVVLSSEQVEQTLGGTPTYMSPEAITLGHAGPKADQYALGCVAYEMLTGTHPFRAQSLVGVMEAHVSLVPPVPSELTPGVSAGVDAIVMRCLAKGADDRFADMRDLEAALCEAQINAGLTTAWDDLSIPEVDPARREWLLSHMPEPETRVEQARRHNIWLGIAAAAVLAGIVAGTTSAALEPDVDPQVVSEIESKAREARAAAARAFFVYPPADAPNTATAFSIVRQMELLEDDSAGPDRASAELRHEFAATLSRLGDQYWDAEGGKPFAVGYYKQAVVFDPNLEPAATRAGVSDAQLSAFMGRASELHFSSEELDAAEPLAVLAEPDERSRAKKLDDLNSRRTARRRQRDAALWKAAGVTPTKPTKSSAPRPAVPSVSDVPDNVQLQAELPAAKRDPKLARRLARQGRSALKAGAEAKAQAMFEQALAQDPRNNQALAGLRDLYFDRGNYARAVRYAKKAVAGAGRKAEHRLRLGDAYFKIARYQHAAREYKKALRLGDSRAKWRLERTQALLGR